MEIGYCLLMLASQHDPLGAKWIPLIKKAGFDFAEIPLGKLYGLSDLEIRAYRRLFEDADLPVRAFNFGLPPGVHIVGSRANAEDVNAYIERTISLAELFGIQVITSCGPIADAAKAPLDWERDGKAQYVAFLQKIADAAKKRNMLYAIEPICREERGYVYNTGQAIALAEAAGRENIKIIVDLFHYDQEHEPFEALPAISKDWVSHIHFADLRERKTPLLAHTDAYAAQLRPVLDAGFCGRISIEAYADNPESDIPQAYAALSSSIHQGA